MPVGTESKSGGLGNSSPTRREGRRISYKPGLYPGASLNAVLSLYRVATWIEHEHSDRSEA